MSNRCNTSVCGNDAVIEAHKKSLGFDLDETVVCENIFCIVGRNINYDIVTICKGTSTYACYIFRNIDAFKVLATTECGFSNSCDAVGEGDVFKIGAILECKAANVFNAVGDGNTCKA